MFFSTNIILLDTSLSDYFDTIDTHSVSAKLKHYWMQYDEVKSALSLLMIFKTSFYVRTKDRNITNNFICKAIS